MVVVAPASARWFLEIFICAQILLPAVMLIPGSQAIRLPIRIAPFVLGFVGLAVAALSSQQRRTRVHPAAPLLIIAIIYLLGMIGLPTTNTLLAGAAQCMLYASVMLPLFWAPGMVRSGPQVQRVMTILLICTGLNALVGVLQVLKPDIFLPREFSAVLSETVGVAKYIGPDGREIIRPPGLSDTPGAVCAPASIAALLGLIFAMRPIAWWQRAASMVFAFTGLAAIFLSHVRTSILIVAGMYVVYFMMLWLDRQRTRALTFLGFAGGLIAISLLFAIMLGGESVAERFATLIEADPTTVYYHSMRGYQLQYDTQQYLQDYPFGAGLGRWGMMRVYFGDPDNPRSPMVWAELQWPAWVLDGGIVLLAMYMLAVLRNTWHEYKCCRALSQTNIAPYAAMIFAANMGVVALIFGFTPFTTQTGMQYWFLAGVLHGAAHLTRAQLSGAHLNERELT